MTNSFSMFPNSMAGTVATTSSAAGATARIAVIVQTGCSFLSGGRRGASADDREFCCGRATVSLTRAIQYTYTVSPLDMSGMVGMVQTLAVYHYGYYTLKAQIHSHESAIVPSDAAAVLEWNLGVPLSRWTSPLAIAMIVTMNGERSLRRYRLVTAQKSRLRLVPEVLATFASHGRDHRLTAHPRASNLAGSDGAGDTVEDPSSDEGRDTTDAETDAETAAKEAWCPRCPTRQTTQLRVRSLVLCAGLIYR